jgi:hypothetical protein
MVEKLLSYLEKRPRAVVAAALTFVLALSAVSGLCFYVLTIVVESERHEAMQQVLSAKSNFEEKTKLLQERARINSEHIVRLADTLAPLLKSQAADIGRLKDEFGNSATDQASALMYAKLSEVQYRLTDIEQRLTAEKVIAEAPIPTASPSPLPYEWLRSYLLRWLTKWSTIVAVGALVLLVLILRARRSPVST